MPDKVTVTTEDQVVPWGLVLVAAAVLAGVGGWVFSAFGPDLIAISADAPTDDAAKAAAAARESVNEIADWCVTVAGALLGAGVGLMLADFRKTKTQTTEKPAEGEVKDMSAAGVGDIVKDSLGLVKDLTPGKTLVVLAVALLGVALVAVSPPDVSSVTVESAAIATVVGP